MRCDIWFTALIVAAVSVVLVIGEKTYNTPKKAPGTPLGVTQPQDISIKRLSRGRPLPEKVTTYTPAITQLGIYRRTVRNRGDGITPDVRIRADDSSNLELLIQHFQQQEKRNNMYLESALYGVIAVLLNMLHPLNPQDGFYESGRLIVNKALMPDLEVPQGFVYLIQGNTDTLRRVLESEVTSAGANQGCSNDTSASSPPLSITAQTNPFTLKPTSLSAPFPIPETDLTLLIGPRGVDLIKADIILKMSGLIITARQDVAISHRVRPVPQHTWSGGLGEEIEVILRPRMNDGTSLVSYTDLVEAAFGLMYFFLTQDAVFATKFTVVKPNQAGRRAPIGEIEIKGVARQLGVESGGAGNDTLDKTAE
ncbi:MAG: hypothetical protein Q9170_004181 [Blastenia crenularia]